MSTQTYTPQTTDTFDLQTGMDVYTADGQKMGSVMDIAGFGSTTVRKSDKHDAGELVIQAKTGTGYFNVGPGDGQGLQAAAPLRVPFYGIEDVVLGHGVTLNGTIIEELRQQRDPLPVKMMIPPTTPRKWWSRRPW